jgi:hypothetical protein
MSDNSNYKSKIQFVQQICNKPHIYKITNLINQKYYYGVHDGSDTQNYDGSGVLLHQAYKKHGKENFKKEILMWFDTEDEAYEYEAVIVNEKMINKNNPMCYNLKEGGYGFTSEYAKELANKRLNEGTHNFQDPEHIKNTGLRQLELSINNQHPFQKQEHRESQGQKQLELFLKGEHPFQKEEVKEVVKEINSKYQKQLSINNQHPFQTQEYKDYQSQKQFELSSKGEHAFQKQTLEERNEITKKQMDNGTQSTIQINYCKWCQLDIKGITFHTHHGDKCYLNPLSKNYEKELSKYLIKKYTKLGIIDKFIKNKK